MALITCKCIFLRNLLLSGSVVSLSLSLFIVSGLFKGAWVSQLVKCPTLAQVMIPRFLDLSSTSGSVLTAQSLEPASDSVSSSLFAPPPLVLCLSKINKCKKKIFLNFFNTFRR